MPFHSLYSPVIHWHDMISMYLLIFFSFTLTAKHFLLSPKTPGKWKKKNQNWGSHFVIFNFVDNAILSRNQIDWNIKRVTPATGEPIHSVACVDMIKVNSGSFPHEHALAHSHSKSTNYFFIFFGFCSCWSTSNTTQYKLVEEGQTGDSDCCFKRILSISIDDMCCFNSIMSMWNNDSRQKPNIIRRMGQIASN